jgi:hypothetical protein
MPRTPNPYRIVGLKASAACKERLYGPTPHSRKREICGELTTYGMISQGKEGQTAAAPRCLRHIPADSVGIHREQPATTEGEVRHAA